MPLNVRAIAINLAVLSFFAAGLLGWVNALSPLTCCKRALAAAIIIYMVSSIAIRVVNAILLNAMIKSHINKQEEKANVRG